MSVARAIRPAQAVLDRFLPRGALLLATLTFATYARGPAARPPVRPNVRPLGRARRVQRGVRPAGARPGRAHRQRPDRAVRADLPRPSRRTSLGRGAGLRPDDRRPLAVVVMAVVAAVLFVFAPQTAAIIAPGFGPEQQDAVHEPLPDHADHAGPLRRVDRAGRDPRRRPALPLLRPRARCSTTSASSSGRRR